MTKREKTDATSSFGNFRKEGIRGQLRGLWFPGRHQGAPARTRDGLSILQAAGLLRSAATMVSDG